MIAHRLSFEDTTISDHDGELQGYIARMEAGDVDIDLLRRIALFCIANPAADPSSPMSPDLDYPGSPSPFVDSSSVPNLHSDIWERNNNSDRFLNALIQCLNPLKVIPLSSRCFYFHSYHLSRARRNSSTGSSSYGKCWKTRRLISKATKQIYFLPCSEYVIATSLT